ncbi:MAG TPA: hypothetical protein VHX64_06700 [Caulobacteraceae bacterium]|nr:hypothetical protein [Caulobacteraceae bacterium]
MLAGFMHWDMLVAALIAMCITAVVTIVLRGFLGRGTSILLGGLILPMSLIGLAMFAITRPNPGHHDLPGMAFAAFIMMAFAAAPLCWVASAIAVLVRDRLVTPRNPA